MPLEQEKRETLEALRQFKRDLVDGKAEILNSVKINKADIEAAVHDALPKNHEQSHEEIRKFIEHAPDPKLHGDHHDFTESVRVRLEHLIVAVFKGLGGIILIALLIGLYTWIKKQV